MAKTGWQIAVDDRGTTRHFIIGIGNIEAAQAKALAQCEGATVLSRTELTKEDFDELGLLDGCVIESTGKN